MTNIAIESERPAPEAPLPAPAKATHNTGLGAALRHARYILGENAVTGLAFGLFLLIVLAALFVALNTTLMAGGRIIWQPRFDLATVLKALPGSTVMMGVPTFYTRLLGDVRGVGLAIGVELVRDRTTLEPAGTEVPRLLNLIRDEGVLVGGEGKHGTVLKIRPPIVFRAEHAGMAIAAIDRALAKL